MKNVRISNPPAALRFAGAAYGGVVELHAPVPLPPRLTDPRPMILTGTAAWVLALVVVLLSGDRFAAALPVCVAGLGVSAFGVFVYLLQRAAVRRGSRTAQRGITA